MGWVVGDGQSIKVWQDPWLETRHQERPFGPPRVKYVDLLVAELMVTGTTEWDHNKIQLCVPDYEERIMCIKPSATGAPDKLVWLGTKTGDYTVKIKTFSWKLLKGALPVGEKLLQRNIAVDPHCKRCGCSESINHLLFQCRFAQSVWNLAPFVTEVDYCSGLLDLAASWTSLCTLRCLPPAGITFGALSLWVIWSLWKARNMFLFEDFSASPEETLSLAIKMAREWSLNKSTDKPPSPT